MTKKWCIFATILVAFVVIGMIACSGDENGQTGPSPITYTPPSGTSEEASPPSSGGNAGNNGNGGNDGGLNAPSCDFEVIRKDIDFKQIGYTTRIKGVVPGSPASSGDTLVYIWFPLVNAGDQYGPYELGDEIIIDLKEYGTFNYQVAVERDIDGDGKADNDCQDDRHKDSVTLREEPGEPECPEGEVEEGGKCYPICNQGEQPNLRGLTVDQAPSCRCPDGSVPDEELGCRSPECDVEVTLESVRSNEEKTRACVSWQATPSSPLLAELLKGTSVENSKNVEAPGSHCFDISCEDSGGYGFRVSYGGEEFNPECKDGVRFDVPECKEECEAPEVSIDIETKHDAEGTEVWVEYGVDGGVGDGTVTVQLTDEDGNVLRTATNQPREDDLHFEMDCEDEDAKYYIVVTFDGETRECSNRLRKPFRVPACEEEHECQLEAPERDAFCLSSPVSGGGQAECDKFVPGSVFQSKTESGDVTAPSDALAAIVKGGASQCEAGEHSYKVIPNVSAGDEFEFPGQSHVTFCGCPPANDLQALLGIAPTCGPNASYVQPIRMRSDD